MCEKISHSIHISSKGLSVLWLLILSFGTACVLNNSDNPISTTASSSTEATQAPLLVTATPANVPATSATPIATEISETPNPTLSANLWVLSAVIYRGENMDVDALYPTYFRFDVERGSLLITTPCEGTDNFVRGIGYGIVFQGEQHYTLSPQEMITVDCGELIDTQSEHLKVLSTSQYEIQDDTLILIGENVQIVLERDNTNP